MNLSRLSGRGGVTHELDPVIFLFSRTFFFEAIEKERGWLGNTEFLERIAMCGVKKKNLRHLFIMPYNMESLRRPTSLLLGEALKSRTITRGLPRRRDLCLCEPKGMPKVNGGFPWRRDLHLGKLDRFPKVLWGFTLANPREC